MRIKILKNRSPFINKEKSKNLGQSFRVEIIITLAPI